LDRDNLLRDLNSSEVWEHLMELNVKQDCTEVDWISVSEILKCVGMAHFKEIVSMRERGFTE
jgi:hypothetical protein